MIKELDLNNKDYINELETSFNYVLTSVKDDIKNNPFSKYLVFIDNNKILGYINYYLIYDRIEIANFDVLPDYQNNHIGTRLLDYLINKYLNKVSNITLEVKIDNNKAINLYKKMGFIEKTIRENYYNGIDGILMERSMKL